LTGLIANVLFEQGIDVIVIDHHTGRETLPDCVLINPHVCDTPEVPWLNLCTVGLVWKLSHGLLKTLRERGDEIAQSLDIKESLDLVAMGTIADMVPLRGENRILARAGLEKLANTNRLDRQTADAFETYVPLVAEKACVECHTTGSRGRSEASGQSVR